MLSSIPENMPSRCIWKLIGPGHINALEWTLRWPRFCGPTRGWQLGSLDSWPRKLDNAFHLPELKRTAKIGDDVGHHRRRWKSSVAVASVTGPRSAACVVVLIPVACEFSDGPNACVQFLEFNSISCCCCCCCFFLVRLCPRCSTHVLTETRS